MVNLVATGNMRREIQNKTRTRKQKQYNWEVEDNYGHYKFAHTKETRQVEYKSQQARQEIPMDTVQCCDPTTLNNPTIWKIFVKGLGFNNIVSE